MIRIKISNTRSLGWMVQNEMTRWILSQGGWSKRSWVTTWSGSSQRNAPHISLALTSCSRKDPWVLLSNPSKATLYRKYFLIKNETVVTKETLRSIWLWRVLVDFENSTSCQYKGPITYKCAGKNMVRTAAEKQISRTFQGQITVFKD